tara:strand:+ start:248 stop:445 length:198 start_codon:yes stop_codon:yes gene_type:complete
VARAALLLTLEGEIVLLQAIRSLERIRLRWHAASDGRFGLSHAPRFRVRVGIRVRVWVRVRAQGR